MRNNSAFALGELTSRDNCKMQPIAGSFLLAAVLAFGCACSLPTLAATVGVSRTACLNNDVSDTEAVLACTFAIKKHPKDAKLFVQRGMAWIKTGDYDFAIGDLSKAIKLSPHNALAFFVRGVAREKRGELQESLADFKRCAELSPSDPEAQRAIERVMVSLAARTPSQTGSSAIAEHLSERSFARTEGMSGSETSKPLSLSGARYDFSLLIPTLFMIASIAAMAMFMHKDRSRMAADHPLPGNLEVEPDPPTAWYWSEYRGEC